MIKFAWYLMSRPLGSTIVVLVGILISISNRLNNAIDFDVCSVSRGQALSKKCVKSACSVLVPTRSAASHHLGQQIGAENLQGASTSGKPGGRLAEHSGPAVRCVAVFFLISRPGFSSMMMAPSWLELAGHKRAKETETS